MDKHTYGNSIAAGILTELINTIPETDRKKVSRKIGRILNMFNKTLVELHKVEPHTAIYLAKTVFHEFVIRAEQLPFGSYVRNVINTKYKDFITEMNLKNALLTELTIQLNQQKQNGNKLN